MKMYLDYYEKNIELYNEFGKENCIFVESQCGPQEEPFLQEINLDVARFRKYLKNKKKK